MLQEASSRSVPLPPGSPPSTWQLAAAPPVVPVGVTVTVAPLTASSSKTRSAAVHALAPQLGSAGPARLTNMVGSYALAKLTTLLEPAPTVTVWELLPVI